MAAKANLGRMLEQNHHIRTSEEGDRWEEYDEHQAILESELRALQLALKDKKEATKVNSEMTRAKEMYFDEVEAIDKESAERLSTLETLFQMVLLLQSMLQSLIILMLMRNCIVLWDWWPGLLVLVLMWLPTELMTFFVTPHVLAQLSLAYAIGVKNKEVLEEMMEDATAEGDYAAAGQVLELAMTAKLSQDELQNEEVVREKVKDLLKLGELKWRYRVVEEGQNPRDEAIKVLDEANQYVMGHIIIVLQQEGKERDEGYITKHKEENWAEELSEVCQGLALARLIFNGNNRDEDATIQDYLRQALKLRQTLKNKPKIADTLNSLGALAQKQQKYKEAEGHYKESLETREKIMPNTDKEAQEKEQFLAQSYVSLGNLYTDMGDFAMALENLTLAKSCYVRGFNEHHPKVAWAVEAQANVHKKMKNYRLAQACIDEAIQIRRALQEKGDGKALFSKEVRIAHHRDGRTSPLPPRCALGPGEPARLGSACCGAPGSWRRRRVPTRKSSSGAASCSTSSRARASSGCRLRRARVECACSLTRRARTMRMASAAASHRAPRPLAGRVMRGAAPHAPLESCHHFPVISAPSIHQNDVPQDIKTTMRPCALRPRPCGSLACAMFPAWWV